jgi:uncharacterized cofD-like protein
MSHDHPMSKQKKLQKIWTTWRGWLYVGIGVKRWLLILGAGVIIVGVGIAALIVALGQEGAIPNGLFNLLTLQFLPSGLRIVVPILLGGAIILAAIIRLGTTLVAPFRHPDEGVAQSLRSFSRKKRGPRIVAIGGGTGLPALLRGLTTFTDNITAIITVADDGGSSGRLRRELGLIPPGDFRNNLAALARDETLMTQLMQYRFTRRMDGHTNGNEAGILQGHAFGNLLLAALTGITGSFDEALIAAGRVLALRGTVLPSTLANINLVAEVSVGETEVSQRIIGESEIPKAGGTITAVAIEPSDVVAFPPAVKAILNADVVVIGPGSLYTSIMPNLLVPGIARAIQRTRALKVYICNLATQSGETDNYNVVDHVTAIDKHIGQLGVKQEDWLDIVLANDNLSLPTDTGGGNTRFVSPDFSLNVKIVMRDLVDESQPWRHDSQKIAESIIALSTEDN